MNNIKIQSEPCHDCFECGMPTAYIAIESECVNYTDRGRESWMESVWFCPECFEKLPESQKRGVA